MPENRIKVLIIEDLNVAQRVALHIFQKLHCQADIVANAAKALERILTRRYDIIFIDIQLPDINGFSLAETIRNSERRWTRMPLIAVTANSYVDLENQAKHAGFDQVLLKPLSTEIVRHTILTHLNKAKAIIDVNHGNSNI